MQMKYVIFVATIAIQDQNALLVTNAVKKDTLSWYVNLQNQ